MDEKKPLKQVVDTVLKDIIGKSLDVLNPRLVGNYAQFQGLELAAAINRLRTLSVQKKV